MALATGVLITVAIFFSMAFIYFIFFGNKGRKVFIEFYELYGGDKPVLLNADKRAVGIIKTIDGKEKFKIPRKYSADYLTPPPNNCIIQAKGNKDVVRLLRVAQGIFVPLSQELKGTKNEYFQYINEQTEPYAWSINERNILSERTKKNDLWTKIAPVAILGIVIIGGLLTIYSTGQQINELNDDYRQQTLGEIQQQKSFVLDLVNNIKGENNNNVTTSDSAQKPLGVE
jgi:hypothetical protein